VIIARRQSNCNYSVAVGFDATMQRVAGDQRKSKKAKEDQTNAR
jgi:hypothetical protein